MRNSTSLTVQSRVFLPCHGTRLANTAQKKARAAFYLAARLSRPMALRIVWETRCFPPYPRE